MLAGAFIIGATTFFPFATPQVEAAPQRSQNSEIAGFGIGFGGGYYGNRPRYYGNYRYYRPYGGSRGYYNYPSYRYNRYNRYYYPGYRYNNYDSYYRYGRPRGGVYFNWR